MRLARIISAGLLLVAVPLSVPLASAQVETPAAFVQMISCGDHRLAFYVIPGTRATIMLDSGSGQHATHWKTLAPELPKRTGFTVISYDRAGLGASDEVAGPWNVLAAVADLAHGLEVLGATKNVILVSHSLAGQIATYVTLKNPGWFVGAVLVDAKIPDFFSDETMTYVKAEYDPTVARFRAAPSTRATRNFLALVDSWDETNHAFHKIEWPAEVPVTVIVSETTPLSDPVSAQRWRDAEAMFAGRALNRKLITATGSSHNVVRDRPDVVIAAINGYAAFFR